MSQIDEKTKLPLSLIFTIGGGAVTISSAILGMAWRQDTRSSVMENALAFVARDVGDIKNQMIEVRATLSDRVTVTEMEGWIRLANQNGRTPPLPTFRR